MIEIPAELSCPVVENRLETFRANPWKLRLHKPPDICRMAVDAMGIEVEVKLPSGLPVVEMGRIVIKAYTGISLVITQFGQTSIPDAPKEHIAVCAVGLNYSVSLKARSQTRIDTLLELAE